MKNFNKIVVVIDPVRGQHLALDRVLAIAKASNEKPQLCLFIGVDSDSSDLHASNSNIQRTSNWFHTITNKVEQQGLKYYFVVSWSDEWHQAILNTAQQFNSDGIFLPDYLDHKLFHLSAQKWAFLRKSTQPVTIVRSTSKALPKTILAAINIQKEEDKSYAELNEKILQEGKRIAESYDADLHVVNAYKHIFHHPGQDKVMERTQLPLDHVHIDEGNVDKIISRYAIEVDADMIIIGTLARTGAAAFIKGNNSEVLLKEFDYDVVVIS
jgi:universal stress protein E